MGFDEVFEVEFKPRVGGEDEGRSGLEESLQGEMVLTCVCAALLCVSGRRL